MKNTQSRWMLWGICSGRPCCGVNLDFCPLWRHLSQGHRIPAHGERSIHLGSSSFRQSTPETRLHLCSHPSVRTLEQSGRMSRERRTLRSSAPHRVNPAVCSEPGWGPLAATHRDVCYFAFSFIALLTQAAYHRARGKVSSHAQLSTNQGS